MLVELLGASGAGDDGFGDHEVEHGADEKREGEDVGGALEDLLEGRLVAARLQLAFDLGDVDDLLVVDEGFHERVLALHAGQHHQADEDGHGGFADDDPYAGEFEQADHAADEGADEADDGNEVEGPARDPVEDSVAERKGEGDDEGGLRAELVLSAELGEYEGGR